MRNRPKQAKIKREQVAIVEAELLKKLREQGPVPRVDLAKQLKLAPSTVGIYVHRLIEDGFITEGKQVIRDVGRPAVMLALNPAGGAFVGVDIEARNVYVTSVDFAQQTLKRVHAAIVPGEETTESVLSRVERMIEEVCVPQRKLLGLGLGVPGTVDPERGVVRYYGHIADWRDVPIRDRLAARFGVPVHVENNIRSLALAERWFGQGRGVDNYLCVGIRSGFGVGIVVDGRLCRGSSNLAGEVAHWPTDGSTQPDATAAGTMLESQVALAGILRRYAAAKGLQTATFAQFAAGVKDADVDALRLTDTAAAALGLFLVQASRLLDPEKIILAGQLPELGDAVMTPLQKTVDAWLPDDADRRPLITVSELGEFGGALGAAALAVHEWRPVH